MKPHQTLGGFKTISDDLANANAVKNAKPTGLCVSPVLAGQVRLYRCAVSMKQVRSSRSNSSNRSTGFGGRGTGGY